MPRPNVEAERREQILRAACDELSEVGMQDLRLSDLARRAGVSSGTIHYYFEGKHAVLVAAFEFNYRRSLERRRRLLDAGDEPLPTLRELVDSYLPRRPEALTAWRVWAQLWAEATRNDEYRAINESLYAEWRGLVTELIARGQDRGSVRDGDPGVLADMLIGMIDGLATQVLAGSKDMPVERMSSTLQQFIYDFLALAPGHARH
ncbi:MULTISPECIES: TetR/AcrR family transcriptional regulator [Streptacidiphilus]|uniref:TetR/AcrR family transcriptional regulator n=1 Tax=Streptacidiphilus cavernicola TaxID=3342716 RepID=A0ABV6UK87_9ACTN|nr:TetR/AcrR family transcriptional regulator [Streptacidiphilus jeojiense]